MTSKSTMACDLWLQLKKSTRTCCGVLLASSTIFLNTAGTCSCFFVVNKLSLAFLENLPAKSAAVVGQQVALHPPCGSIAAGEGWHQPGQSKPSWFVPMFVNTPYTKDVNCCFCFRTASVLGKLVEWPQAPDSAAHLLLFSPRDLKGNCRKSAQGKVEMAYV